MRSTDRTSSSSRPSVITGVGLSAAPEGVGSAKFESDGTRDVASVVTGTFTAPDAGNQCGWQDLADVLEAVEAGDAYVNVHTTQHRGGEIRGQLAAD